MEKKTIGKFIAVLRKANGMTQKELGEKLLVSDKTVSRWENDEFSPDISLLPAIAEIFGITVDELLRGERNNPEREGYGTEETEAKQTAKSEKQFKNMLGKRLHLYRGLSFISISLLVVAFLIAVTVNFVAKRGDIAFMCSIIVCVASEICQVLFAHNAWVHFDEDDDVCRDQVVSINNKIARTAVAISFACFGSVAFYLPIVKCYELISKGFTDVYAGENHFFLIGGLTAICALFGAFAIYTLFVRKALHKKGIIVLNDHEEIVCKRNKKMMSTMAIVFLCVTIVFCVGMAVLNNVQLTKKELYSSWGDVKATTEHDYNQWVKENFGDDELMKMYADKEYKAYKELVEAYEDYGFKEIEFYYHKDHYTSDGFVAVYPENEYVATAKQYQAVRIINDRVSEIAKPILYSVLVADVVISAIVYYVLARKNKNQDLNDEAVEEAI